VTGVVDWDGAGRGDRRLDLVTSRCGLHGSTSDDAVVERLDAVLDAMPVDVLRTAWERMSLRLVGWAIRHFSAAGEVLEGR
jgi:aminoglycoside phosphotransferase (APT) family kinase protein